MTTHTIHKDLPGYDPDRVLQDGCPECERRGENPTVALVQLDAERFAKAWQRAADWQRDRLKHPISAAEAPMLRVLWSIQLLFERYGIAELGVIPARQMANVNDLDELRRVYLLGRNVANPDSDVHGRLTELEREVISVACRRALDAMPNLFSLLGLVET